MGGIWARAAVWAPRFHYSQNVKKYIFYMITGFYRITELFQSLLVCPKRNGGHLGAAVWAPCFHYSQNVKNTFFT